MSEPIKRNPTHPVTEFMDTQWVKIVALLMYRDGVRFTSIPPEIVAAANADARGLNVAIRFDDVNGIELHLMGDTEAKVLAKQEGG